MVSTTLHRLFQQGHVGRKRIRQGVIVIDEEEGVERPRVLYKYTLIEKGRHCLAHITAKTRT